jgi:DNA-directed RNA polymerase specialized sigma24 family protein
VAQRVRAASEPPAEGGRVVVRVYMPRVRAQRGLVGGQRLLGAAPVLERHAEIERRGRVNPLASATGPITYASRKEQLHLATLAMDGLPPRDRELVRLMTASEDIEEIAARLDLSRTAAQRARLRAMERFQKIVAIMERQRRAPGPSP